MNQAKISMTAASIIAVVTGVSLSTFTPEFLVSANADQLDNATKALSSDLSVEASPATKEAIAKVYAHELEGKEAVTVYVRDIPVATYVGDSAFKDNTVEVATTEQANLPVTSKAMTRATDLVAAINQLEPENAEQIGVKWNKESQQYEVHLDQQTLIQMTGNVILPKTTNDKAEDALQITNRLRRQIGRVEPLQDIEGRPAPPPPPAPAPKVAVVPQTLERYQQGWASWYGPGFHGNLTASGARYNQYGLTAAHRTLPFGTKLRVTNLDNGRSVIVTVNDRGPFIHNRVIDLSFGAAQVLGVVNSGVARVSLDFVN